MFWQNIRRVPLPRHPLPLFLSGLSGREHAAIAVPSKSPRFSSPASKAFLLSKFIFFSSSDPYFPLGFTDLLRFSFIWIQWGAPMRGWWRLSWSAARPKVGIIVKFHSILFENWFPFWNFWFCLWFLRHSIQAAFSQCSQAIVPSGWAADGPSSNLRLPKSKSLILSISVLILRCIESLSFFCLNCCFRYQIWRKFIWLGSMRKGSSLSMFLQYLMSSEFLLGIWLCYQNMIFIFLCLYVWRMKLLVYFNCFVLIYMWIWYVRYLREEKPRGSAGGLYSFRDYILEDNPVCISSYWL